MLLPMLRLMRGGDTLTLTLMLTLTQKAEGCAPRLMLLPMLRLMRQKQRHVARLNAGEIHADADVGADVDAEG